MLQKKKKKVQNLVASKNYSRSIWKAINTLTNKDASKPQVTVKELSPKKPNSHFANVSDTIITNDQSKLNDLRFLKRFCESKISNFTLTTPPIAIYEVYNALLQLKQTGTQGLDDLDGKIIKIKHFLNAHARKLFFHAHIQPIIDSASTLWDSASANTLKPLVSIHKRALKLTLLKSTSLTENDYKLLDVLPLRLKLKFNNNK